MAEVINVKFREVDKKPLREKVSNRLNQFKDFVVENRDMLVVIVPAIAGLSATMIKVVKRIVINGQEKQVKELYCYDNHLGHYWRLKRKLSNREWLEIDRRKSNGESLSAILNELRVLR